MESILTLIGDYGTAVYIILFLYCALKSGALPLFGGYAAQQGVLDPVLVGIAALAGGYLGDELRFGLARRYGTAWVAERARLELWMDRCEQLLKRYGVAYMFLYRYPKGMRTIGALPVGMTDISWRRFTLLNAASAITWATLLVGVGYVFGEAIEAAVAKGWGLASVILLIVFVALIWRGFRRLARGSLD
jgi:membrane-associated protein